MEDIFMKSDWRKVYDKRGNTTFILRKGEGNKEVPKISLGKQMIHHLNFTTYISYLKKKMHFNRTICTTQTHKEYFHLAFHYTCLRDDASFSQAITLPTLKPCS